MENKSFLVPSSIVLAGVLIAGAVVYTNGPRIYDSGNIAQVKKNVAQQQIPADLKLRDGDHVLGNPNAKVTIIEYSDFECPFCGRMFAETLPKIKENFVKSGEAKFVYRHFPLRSIHKDAQKAAEASECASDQGKFWEYHDKVFEKQSSLGIENLKLWAKDLGLNSAQFDSCLDFGKYSTRVDIDYNEGLVLEINGTPATFVNGKLISGAQPYEEFEKVIREELK